ncbi:bifunctional phosphoglucose/phosphomannose isomerase [Candidatus Dojkabacteria bacterium]|nr:bifunctional phosphoglucose/phosphomannose isomerase [Candidatus Dojkabacteria bacterium]
MINQKYYNDMLSFPNQFTKGFKLAVNTKIMGNFNKVVLCGMGGSSYYVGLINDILKSNGQKLQVVANRAYSLPSDVDEHTLFLIVSFSGNTEEIIENYTQAKESGYSTIIISSGGRLEEIAQKDNIPIIKVPTGTQPRLSSGYFIAVVLQILNIAGLISDFSAEIEKAVSNLDKIKYDTEAKEFAYKLKRNLPIIYATGNIKSSAEIAKTKLNENSKVQAFWNYFPELNHNEMVSFTNLVTDPFFIIFKSKFAHERNARRVEVFKQIMTDKKIPVVIIEPKGESVLEELLYNYSLMDFVSYCLAEELGIDPEPVKMVEEFKVLLKKSPL